MRAEDIELLVSVDRPAIHPDGDRIVVAVGHPDLGADRAVSQLWEFAVDGGRRRRLTRGAGDSSPRFSPDGRVLAFLRSAGGPPQLHIVDALGGEPIAVTDQPLGVSRFDWSPDSRTIAFIARVPEQGRYGSVEGLGADAEPPRRFTTRTYSANGLGWSTDRRAQLFAVEVPALDAEPVYDQAPRPDGSTAKPDRVPTARRLSHVDGDLVTPTFTPDGDAVVVIGALHDTRDEDLRSDAWRVPLGGGDPELLTPGTTRGTEWAGFGPDGRLWTLGADLGPSGLDFIAANTTVAVQTEDGFRVLTDPEALDLSGGEPVWRDEHTMLALSVSRGAVRIVAVSDTGEVTELSGSDRVVTDLDARAGVVAASVRRAESFGELAVLDADGLRELTSFGEPIRSAGLVLPHEETHPSRDGAPVHGWVTVPTGAGPHPVLLMIHGGPYAQYDVGLFDETQVLVDAGYAVVQCNPRGSAGYGSAHGRVIRQRMGTVDLDDVLAFLDGAITAHPELDGTRTGVLGGSYGGYLTAWTIAHDHRFAAAIVERGYLDPEAFIGTSDIGAFFSDEYTGADPATRATQSPQAVVDRVRTPTLVMHSEDDLRCPLPQATRYYQSLKRNGIETELVVFPGENHELSRSGRPRHRVERFEIALDWFQRHLPVESVG